MSAAIALRGVSKCYEIFKTPSDRLRYLLFPGSAKSTPFWALRNVDLEVEEGSTVGIVGRNGSGKSTLLQIVAGTMTQTAGTVEKLGRVSALLELGSGFNPEYTGRQNVLFNGRLLGLTQAEIEEKYEAIAGFADIGEFLDYPIKTYSSGMVVRLAFSVAISVTPKILIVDEALAVGDARFQQKCMAAIRRLSESGVAILFVSHDSEAIKRLCNYALVLDKGEIVKRGNPVQVANWYLSLMAVNFDVEKQRAIEKAAMDRVSPVDGSERYGEANRSGSDTEFNREDLDIIEVPLPPLGEAEEQIEEDPELRSASFGNDFRYYRHGDGAARIVTVLIRDERGELTDTILLGSAISIEIYVDFLFDQSEHVLGIALRDRLGTNVIDLNTCQEKVQIPPVREGDRCLYQFTFQIDARPGMYGLTVGIAYTQYEMRFLDWIENIKILRVSDPEPARMVFGIYLPRVRRVVFKNVRRKSAIRQPSEETIR